MKDTTAPKDLLELTQSIADLWNEVRKTRSRGYFRFFRQEGVPVSLTRDNSRMQTSVTWNEYMRRYWVKDNSTEPYHPGQNPFKRDQALWKRDSTKIMIESEVDPRGWFRVMCHTADLHNHRANSSNEDNIPPLTKAKSEIVT